MTKDNICVSAFGFKDVVCINGKVYTVPEAVPSVIIEDSEHKFNMYSHDSILERTGMGLNQLDDHKARIPVCVLWQQLKQFESGAQYDAAKRLAKYVLSLIIHAYSELYIHPEGNEPVKINKSYLRSNTQITLCIPDFFDESEQQCLLDAFEGFDFRLLWRSIAAIMGSFNEEKPLLDNTTCSDQITVVYLGPDSFDVTSYDYQVEADGYVTPIRRTPVYSNCSLATSFPAIAISNATQILKRDVDPQGTFSQTLQLSLLSQLFFNSPFIWLEQADEGIKSCEALCINIGKGNHWHVFDSKNIDMKMFLTNGPLFDLAENFLTTYNLNVEATQSQCYSNQSLADLLSQQLYNLLTSQQQQPPRREYVIFTGPFAFNPLIKEVFEIIPAHNSSCSIMVTGGYIFNERMSQDLPTYLDRMRKLSMISRSRFNDYVETVLISSGVVKPSKTFRSKPIPQSIQAESDAISLYVSSDERFTTETINQATSVSFADQNIEVYAATLPFKSGAKTENEEPVTVTVEQKVLSGYFKVLIKPAPNSTSTVLPQFGLTAAFDPNTKKLFTGCLPMLNNSYPNLVKPNLYQGPEVNYQIERSNLVFSSTNNRADVLYYNNEFAYDNLKSTVYWTINQQISNIWHLITQPQTEDSVIQVLTLVENRNFLVLSFPELKSNEAYMTLVNYFDQAVCNLFPAPHLRGPLAQALRMYSSMIPDEPSFCSRCADMYGKLIQIYGRNIDCQILADIRMFIENHPQSFSSHGNNFAMTNNLSWALFYGGQNLILKVLNQRTALSPRDILFNQRIIGSRNLSSSLAAIMYALLWRKSDKTFLGTEEVIAPLLNLLSGIQQKLNILRDGIMNCNLNDKIFETNLRKFVEATPITINNVIEYLYNKGTNSNIMASIDEIDQENKR